VTAPSPNAPSVRARLAAQAARLNAAMRAAVNQVTAALPAVSADEATAALEAAVPITVKGPARFLEELAAHMAAHPDALTSGSSACPPVLLRLARVLHESGHPVVRPGCAGCGVIRDDLRQLREEGRLCGSCDARSRKNSTCGRCGNTGILIVARRPDGGICHRCYRRDPEVVEECRGCGRVRNPVVRLPDGGALCIGCWERPQHTCVSCGTTAPAALVAEEGAYCHLCYDRHRRPLRECGKCGRMAKIQINARDGQPDLCDRCYRGPELECSRCGRVRPCTRVASGEPICRTCYHRDERPLVTCARCHRDKPANAFWPIGPVCMNCYNAIVRAPAECASCHQDHPLIGRDESGAGICGPCAGHDIDFTCRQCGRSGYPYGRGRCAYCVLADRVAELLADPDGAIAPELQPLADAFSRVHLPFRAIQWIRESPAAAILAHLVAQQRPLTHDLLDELPPDRSLHYLRQTLVQTGILPQRNEEIERVPAWLEHHLAGKPAGHARLVRPFLHWSLLRRARSRAVRRPVPASTGREMRRRILIALELLAWIDKQGTTLDRLSQEDVDRWLGEEETQRRYRVSYFLAWTADRRLSHRLTVPDIPRQQPADFLDDDQRWQLLQRCLTDSSMPVGVRAAGALVLLFALQLQRIRHLTAGQITEKDGEIYLTAGRRPVLLPPRLGTVLRELAAQPPPRLMISNAPDAPRWLFPGRVPGQPLDLHSLINQLNRHGISARPARNGALAALASDLPAAVLADFLGIHVNTAVRWVTYARQDWTAYLAARDADLRPAPDSPKKPDEQDTPV
jgi:ribosomal protein L40E